MLNVVLYKFYTLLFGLETAAISANGQKKLDAFWNRAVRFAYGTKMAAMRRTHKSDAEIRAELRTKKATDFCSTRTAGWTGHLARHPDAVATKTTFSMMRGDVRPSPARPTTVGLEANSKESYRSSSSTVAFPSANRRFEQQRGDNQQQWLQSTPTTGKSTTLATASYVQIMVEQCCSSTLTWRDIIIIIIQDLH
jgi:hypothetical protein